MERKKILIVEDELDMRIFISTLMEVNGFEPVATRDGKEGIQKARGLAPDLIILDVMMPNEGGVEMYRQLKADNGLKDIPVIMLSAIARKTFCHYLKMLGRQLNKVIPDPDAYMEKPPEAEDLVKLASGLINR